MPTFEKRTFIRAPPERLFAFHESPDALERLIPPEDDVRVVSKSAPGLHVGTVVVLEMKVGPVRLRWVAEHTAYDPPRSFKDVQRSGPFAHWEHTHLVEPVEGGAELVDRVEYRLPFGPLGALGAPFARRKLERMFAWRHDVTKKVCEEAS
jgi:ligand-binding SRPBCC domain-containing protein